MRSLFKKKKLKNPPRECLFDFFLRGSIHGDKRYKSESQKLQLKSEDVLGTVTGPDLEKKLKYAEDVTGPFKASEVGGEKFWRMPPEESYWEFLI
ncbi:hypothetical protein V6N13_051647 [Hibiscus sabdariffa]